MKTLRTWLATMVVLLYSATVVKAHDFEVNGIYYNITSSGDLTVEVTHKGDMYNSYSNEYTGEVVIPKSVTYNGSSYSVTSISIGSFMYCTSLTSVTIPSSVMSIGQSAFNGCSNLMDITIPNSVTSIGKYAFRNCSKLTSINFPNSITYIEDGAFLGCTNLSNVYITDLAAWCNVVFRYVGSHPFNEAGQGHLFLNGEEITDLLIPNTVTSIGDWTFLFCTSLIGVTIPNSVTSIGMGAFCFCSGLPIVTIPSTVTSIGLHAFKNCTSLSDVTIPNSVTSIGSSAFEACKGLTNITLPNSLTSIEPNTFWGCTKLTNITIPESVTSIGGSAFLNCYSLTNITIPRFVTSIGQSAFGGCTGLTSVTIPNSVTNIEQYAFSSTGLTSVTIPASVTSIPNRVFQDCKGLTNIIVESGNKIYDSRDNCNAIIETGSNTLISGCKTTIIPHSVTSIGDYAFIDCSGLMNITIPKSVTSLGKGTFSYCENLASVTIPNSVTSMGNAAFEGCSNLTDITIKNPIPFSISTMSGIPTFASLTVPNGSAKAYSDMGGFWGQFAAIKEEANVNISEENMWSTCVLAFDAELPEGVRAFISTGMDENSVLMEEVTILEAYKPYVLYAQNGYEGTLTGVVDLTAYQETVTDGVLSGAIVKQEASSGYILQNQGQGSKFYNMNGQTFTIPAGKCWLSAFDAGASSVTMRFTGGVTGIEGVYMERPTGVEGADMLYDLEGRRVENPLPGRVYIKGGKKVMLKN